ncbi:MAG: hypothetical protein M1834_008566 [Cirrosporium novae-zelandiae]|nr:MAG: hypothetical protein M1834_008566 [Cirrosporium novae-zelandiae]
MITSSPSPTLQNHSSTFSSHYAQLKRSTPRTCQPGLTPTRSPRISSTFKQPATSSSHLTSGNVQDDLAALSQTDAGSACQPVHYMPAEPSLDGAQDVPQRRPNSTEPNAANLNLAKRARPSKPSPKVMPRRYEICNTHDLVVLIADMLMELIHLNDDIPLRDGRLTRFHSRSPPGISVIDYLQRLTTHATLSPPILLSMVYYIDRLCVLYPAFTISSLTVHRFLITAATVASKGLSDSFWTNKTYARVGGVSIRELALLELEFLWRVEWRIVPKPEVLVDYYMNLIKRNEGYILEDEATTEISSLERDNGSERANSSHLSSADGAVD